MADRLEITITIKGTSVECPALFRQIFVPTLSCVNGQGSCDHYVDLESNSRGTKHWIVCKYREKPRGRTKRIFGYGKSITPKEVMIEKGENLKWLEEELGGDVKELAEIRRKLMDKARRQSQ